MNIKECQKGEIPYKYGNEVNLIECVMCELNKYSFDIKNCYDCPEGATCKGGTNIIVNKGYWRKNLYSENVVFCKNL